MPTGTVSSFRVYEMEGTFMAGANLVSRPANGIGTSSEESRLVVLGDSDFASNRNLLSGKNGEFLVGITNWLTEGENDVSIERKVLSVRRLLLTPEEARFLQLSSIILLPLAIFLFAIYAWWRKKLN